MATFSITINDRSNKAKHIIGLLKEIAKTEKFIEIEQKPNEETLSAINDVILKKGITKTKNSKDSLQRLRA